MANMDYIVRDEEGNTLGIIQAYELESIREHPNTNPFYRGLKYTLRFHYSSRLYNILEKAHTLMFNSIEHLGIIVDKVSLDTEYPFISIDCHMEVDNLA